MRTSIFGGLLLAVAAPLLLGVNALLDLELEAVVLLGTAVGAVTALVPDRTPGARLLGLLAGVVVGWVSYIVRAGFLPDSATGRALAVALALALCVLVAVVTRERLALWSALLGTAAMAGAYEYTFAAAPTEVLSATFSTVTALLMATAVGYLVCSAVPPASRTPERAHARDDVRDRDLTMENKA